MTSPTSASPASSPPAPSRPSSDATALDGADAVFICVPTPFDQAKSPDLTYVRSATETVAASLRPGMLVVLQSTTYPGTTTEVVQPILEAATGRGLLVAGVDFNLAFSPERVDPGNATWTVRNTPKVVGGITPECADRTRLLLESIMDGPGLVTVLSSPAAAELTKLLENTYRAVNIALVNELGDARPRDAPRPLGGHRRRRHQALRLPGLLPRRRAGRALHPRRPVLPVVAGPGVRLPDQVHRAGRRHQPPDGRRTCASASSRR